MARLLVAHTYHLALDPPERALGRPYPPLGTLVTAAAARAAGLDVAVYDGTFAPSVAVFADALRGHRPERVAIVPDPHAVPQKMVTSSLRDAALEMIRLAKASGAAVAVSGPDASDHPEAYRSADLVVRGEHDAAMLAWLRTGEPRGVLPRTAPMSSLAGLPSPAWDLVDLGAYRDRWRARHGRWELNLSAARGCPYRCNWCAKPTWGRTYHARPAAEFAAEVRHTYDTYRPDRLWFTDDIFALKASWLTEYHQAIGAPVPFRCLSRADLLADPAYVAALAAAGCVEVWIGAESASPAVLDAMDKDQTVEEIRASARLLRAHGIRYGFFLQLGYPGETYRDVLATVAMCRELAPDEIGVSVAYPLPGTVFHDRVRGEAPSESWTHSMENRPLFRTTHPPAFYGAAREVLRAEHALRLAREGVRGGVGGVRPLTRAAWHAARWPLYRGQMAWYGRQSS